MTWVTEHYKNPTDAQLAAEQARKILNELDIMCSCEYGQPPKESYFELRFNDTVIQAPSYVPVTKTCRKCELNNILYGIMDPDDVAGVFT